MRTFEQIEAFSRENGLFPKGCRVLACVSGGADSTVLLFALHELYARLGLGGLIVCHFNHGLRGADSDADELHVRQLCDKLSLPFVCEQAHMSERVRPAGLSTELWARQLRYEFFYKTADDNRCDVIAVAHNANDNAETVLFNLVRGTSLRGACGIPVRRERIVRPLLCVSRADIERCCEENAYDYVTDKTNFENDCSRNILRNVVFPQLEEINFRCRENINGFSKRMRLLDDFLSASAREALESAKTQEGYDAQKLLCVHEAVACEAVKLIIEPYCTNLCETMVERALDVARGKLGELQLCPETFLARTDGILLLRRTEAAQESIIQKELHEGQNEYYAGKSVELRRVERPEGEQSWKIYGKLLNYCADCDRIVGKLIVRSRETGDVFSSHRRGNTKTVKKLFNEKKIDAKKRCGIAVICDSAGIVFVEGEGISERVAVDDNTKEYFVISISKGNE